MIDTQYLSMQRVFQQLTAVLKASVDKEPYYTEISTQQVPVIVVSGASQRPRGRKQKLSYVVHYPFDSMQSGTWGYKVRLSERPWGMDTEPRSWTDYYFTLPERLESNCHDHDLVGYAMALGTADMIREFYCEAKMPKESDVKARFAHSGGIALQRVVHSHAFAVPA